MQDTHPFRPGSNPAGLFHALVCGALPKAPAGSRRNIGQSEAEKTMKNRLKRQPID